MVRCHILVGRETCVWFHCYLANLVEQVTSRYERSLLVVVAFVVGIGTDLASSCLRHELAAVLRGRRSLQRGDLYC